MFSYWWAAIPWLLIAIVCILFIRGATRDVSDEAKDAESNPIRVS